jgi:hypothetical protein
MSYGYAAISYWIPFWESEESKDQAGQRCSGSWTPDSTTSMMRGQSFDPQIITLVLERPSPAGHYPAGPILITIKNKLS